MDIVNLSEQEIYRLSESSHCHLVGKVLLRRLKCQKSYELWQNKFEEGKEYLLWIGQCHAPNGKSNVFYHFVASPQRRREDAAIFSLVPLDTFDDYPKEDTDMLVEIEGEEYKLIKDFNGFAKLIPKWTLDRAKMQEYIQKEFGETPYRICARIMGTNIAPNDIFVGWEILTRKTKYSTVAYYNIFESKLVKNLGTLTYIQPMGCNQKACIMGGSQIKFCKNKIQIKIGR